MIRNHSLLYLSFFLLVSSGCHPARTYDVRGRIVGFGDDGRTIIVEHEDIPGLMPAMTMPFKTVEAGNLEGFAVGQAIRFKLSLTGDSSWIHDIGVLEKDDLKLPEDSEPDSSLTRAPGAQALLTPGDRIPDVTLVDERAQSFNLADYRGKTVLLTFIYTRCPIPDYCPLMSKQFARLQPTFKERYDGRAVLLSVSFDTTYDRPPVLRQYARLQKADPSIWRFATGSSNQIKTLTGAIGLYSEKNGKTFDHTLATVLIGPDGRILEIWRGNKWTTDQVLSAIEQSNINDATSS